MNPWNSGVCAFGLAAVTACGTDKGGDSTVVGTTTVGWTVGTPATTTTGTDGHFQLLTWTDDGATPTDTDGDGLADAGCGDRLDIEIHDPLGVTDWDFGMAESGATGWTGEDCFNGYGTYNLCHAVGVNHTLDEVPDCQAGSVVAGSTTLFDAEKEPFLTYFLDDRLGACFTFGADPEYYASLGCSELN